MWLADECRRPAVTFLEGLSPTRWLLAFFFFSLKQQASALTLGPWHLSDTGGEIDGTCAPERRSDDCPMLLGCWLVVVHILWEFSSDEKESDGVISLGKCFEMGPAQFLGRLQLAAARGLNYSALLESKDKQDLNWPQRKPQSGLKKKNGQRSLLPPAAHFRACLFFYTIYVLYTAISNSFLYTFIPRPRIKNWKERGRPL